MAIIISDILPFNNRKEDAFEELVCQIVRRTKTKDNPTWYRLHGSGGDGGIEAYWWEKNEKHGIQAKWFLKSGDIDWSQIEKSFKTALRIHPDITDYHVYLACDLTPKTARTRKNGSPYAHGVQDWETFETKMDAYATTHSHKVKIHRHTLSDVFSEISKPECVGLIEFWFNGFQITKRKLEDFWQNAFDELGERYHPEDHVELSASVIFKALARDNWLVDQQQKIYTSYGKERQLIPPIIWSQEHKSQVDLFEKRLSSMIEGFDPSNITIDQPYPYSNWHGFADECREKSYAIQSLERDFTDQKIDTQQQEKNSTFFRECRKRISPVYDIISAFDTYWAGIESKRAALVIGPAGIGKSHFLANETYKEIESGGAAILLMGHWFDKSNLWDVIANRLGAGSINKDKILGALNSFAEANSRRAIIAIDALNESQGTNWLRALKSFINDIKRFPNLAVVISCRDVYVPYVIADDVKEIAHTYFLNGFQTPEEQEQAAVVFLDKRGIVRPSFPWLDPEFRNPLFLRATALSLEKKKMKEFPRGLNGAKDVFSFFIDAISSTMNAPNDRDTSFPGLVKKALNNLAQRMAETKKDYLLKSEAGVILDKVFENYKVSCDWLEIFEKSSLLDRYPKPVMDPDPYNPPPDIVRFIYQRLQDYLMAQALLQNVSSPTELFDTKSTRNIIFITNKSGIKWQYWGLVEALSVQLAEKFKVELFDIILSYTEKDVDQSLHRAFLESVRWRQANSVTDRTIEIIKENLYSDHEWFALIAEFTFRDNHRLNSDFLHEILSNMRMADRDSHWTMALSRKFENTVFEQLVDWSAKSNKSSIDSIFLKRAANTIAWMLSSTSRYARDKATKALSSMYVDCPDIFPWLMERFQDIDDLYISERLLASAYGYLLRTQCHESLEQYTKAVSYIFETNAPVPHLFVRDYARSIIELADKSGVKVDAGLIKRAQPPYESSKPVFNVTEKQVKIIATKAGGEQILGSCSGWHADFKNYKLDRELTNFIKIPLTKSVPLTPSQKMARFEEKFSKNDPVLKLIRELREYKDLSIHHRMYLKHTLKREPTEQELLDCEATRERSIQAMIAEIRSQLGMDLKKGFNAEWLTSFKKPYHSRNSQPMFDKDEAGFWVARRAYAYGWNQKRFGKDNIGSHEAYSRSRSTVERVGKKYQWLARSELFSRLADNYWFKPEYSEEDFRIYNHPNDLSFERYIDPSIFSHSTFEQFPTTNEQFLPQKIIIQPKDGDERLDWPFETNPEATHLDKREFVDDEGVTMIRLNWFSVSKLRLPVRDRISHGFTQEEYFFLNTKLMTQEDAQRLISELQKTKDLSQHDFTPREFTDHPYLYECGLMEIWPLEQFQEKWLAKHTFDPIMSLDLVEEYAWESHLDKTLPEGLRVRTLSSWIMKEFGLIRNPKNPREILNSKNELIARDIPRENGEYADHGYGLVVRKDFITEVLTKKKLDVLFSLTGERSAWSDKDTAGSNTRRNFYALGIGFEVDNLTSWHSDRDNRHNLS